MKRNKARQGSTPSESHVGGEPYFGKKVRKQVSLRKRHSCRDSFQEEEEQTKGSEARTGFPCLRDSKQPRGERSEPGRQTKGKRQTGSGAEPAESEATLRTWNFNAMGSH